MSKQSELLRGALNAISKSKQYTLDVNKINTLEDVKKVLEGLDFRIVLMEGTKNEEYEKLKDYLVNVTK